MVPNVWAGTETNEGGEEQVSEDHDLDALDWKKVESSNVQEAAWNNDTLYVKFRSGTYRYHGVPEGEFDRLLEAGSAGRFVRSEIVPRYDALRVG